MGYLTIFFLTFTIVDVWLLENELSFFTTELISKLEDQDRTF